ncbi:MAG: isoprenoid biosynthesis glyoxalase ElbB [Phycisphaerales bacterium]
MAPRIAVVLCGCGRADGSEIHESVSVLVHLARLNAAYTCFAPDQWQAGVVNHATGEPAPGEKRNCLVEAARISRGNIQPLTTLHESAFDAVIFPGGFGAAKNLCTFAADGAAARVIPDVERVIKGFHAAGKPIGLCCIAPVLAAKVLGTRNGGPGCRVTVGQSPEVGAAIASWGSTSVPVAVDQAVADDDQRIFTSPAYMDDHATPWQVYTGIGRMVEATVAACRVPAHAR